MPGHARVLLNYTALTQGTTQVVPFWLAGTRQGCMLMQYKTHPAA